MQNEPWPPVEVVDSHVHVFPPDVVRRRELTCAQEPWFELLYLDSKALLVTYEALIEAMDEAKVRHAVLCGFPWTDPVICHEHNTYLVEAVSAHPDRFSWLGTVSPRGESAVAEAEWCFKLGAAGLGELNADAQSFDWREPDQVAELAALCISVNKPILIHTSEPVGHAYPGKGQATPDKVLAFVERYPELRVVAAHWGGGLPFYELMPEVGKAMANVVYDCAATSYLYRPQVFRSVLDIVGPQRVMFGSDFPVLRIDRLLERVRRLEWRNDAELEAVLAGNAKRVFRIDRAGAHDT